MRILTSTCPPFPSPLRSSPLLSVPLLFFTTPLLLAACDDYDLSRLVHTSHLDHHFHRQSILAALLSAWCTPLSLPTSPKSIKPIFTNTVSPCSRTSFSLLSSPRRRLLPTRTCSSPLLALNRTPHTPLQTRMPAGSMVPISPMRTSSSVAKRFPSSVSVWNLTRSINSCSSFLAFRVVEQPRRWLHQDGSDQDYGGQRLRG